MPFNSNYNEQQQWNTNQTHQSPGMQSQQIEQTGLPTATTEDNLGAAVTGASSCSQKQSERMRQDEGECID